MRIIVKRQVIFDIDMMPDVHLGMKSETTPVFSWAKNIARSTNVHPAGKEMLPAWKLSTKNNAKKKAEA